MKILVADDEPVSRVRLVRALQAWGYDVLSAEDGNEAWRLLGETAEPMLLVVDWMMPGMDGLELCRRVRADAQLRFHYVIVLTARSDTTDIVAALEAGADDFIVKPYHPDELKVRVRAGVRILKLQHELHLKASHDDLTCVLNRRMALEMLDREIERARRLRSPLTLMMVDIDHFKSVNDRHGHLVGDDVLRQVAARLAAALRKCDSLGRYGGEEFVMLLPDCDDRSAAEVALRVRDAVRNQPITTGGAGFAITVSVGVATAPLPGRLDRQALLRAADRALYRAKETGRDKVEIAGADDF